MDIPPVKMTTSRQRGDTMSVFKKQTIIASFPAYDVVEREVSPLDGVVQITGDDILGVVSRCGRFYYMYSPGSVVSYALQYNRCPLKAVAEAKERGEELHWLNQCSVALTSHRQAPKTLVKVEIGMKVCFEGLYATIEAAPNDNLKFKPL